MLPSVASRVSMPSFRRVSGGRYRRRSKRNSESGSIVLQTTLTRVMSNTPSRPSLKLSFGRSTDWSPEVRSIGPNGLRREDRSRRADGHPSLSRQIPQTTVKDTQTLLLQLCQPKDETSTLTFGLIHLQRMDFPTVRLSSANSY